GRIVLRIDRNAHHADIVLAGQFLLQPSHGAGDLRAFPGAAREDERRDPELAEQVLLGNGMTIAGGEREVRKGAQVEIVLGGSGGVRSGNVAPSERGNQKGTNQKESKKLELHDTQILFPDLGSDQVGTLKIRCVDCTLTRTALAQ